MSYGGLSGITPETLERLSFQEIDEMIETMRRQKQLEYDRIKGNKKAGSE